MNKKKAASKIDPILVVSIVCMVISMLLMIHIFLTQQFTELAQPTPYYPTGYAPVYENSTDVILSHLEGIAMVFLGCIGISGLIQSS